MSATQNMMSLFGQILIVLSLFRLQSAIGVESTKDNEIDSCHLSPKLLKEIESYRPVVEEILNVTLSGAMKGKTWDELAYFVDTFGPRFTGTKVLEDAIDYVLEKSTEAGLENVHGEPVTVPHWVRGKESATLLKPRLKDIALLGLGYSVGTPEKGLQGKVIVVNSFQELVQRKDEVPGKIVVYNQEFVSYHETVAYRENGASYASKYGAIAALVRSVTPHSLYTPHTGTQFYEKNVKKIPVACITMEDATLLRRFAERGEEIEIQLKMDAKTLPDTTSRNVVADIQGKEAPEKIVVVSGHIDSWDVGQGAMDDGGGAFISWQAIKVLKHLNYKARRTVRMIMWTAEELGIIGAQNYIKRHQSETPNIQFVLESDMGTFKPLGLEFTASSQVGCILEKVVELLSPMGNMRTRQPNGGPDIQYWVDQGVPGGSLWNQNDKYFNYHHTNADTMLVEDPTNLDMGTALFAAVAYVLADISVDFPTLK